MKRLLANIFAAVAVVGVVLWLACGTACIAGCNRRIEDEKLHGCPPAAMRSDEQPCRSVWTPSGPTHHPPTIRKRYVMFTTS